MMYVLAYLLRDYGLSKWYATLVEVDDKENEMEGNKIRFINDFLITKNPYNDVYFAVVEPVEAYDVKTNMKPLFVHRIFIHEATYSHNVYIYAFRMFYEVAYSFDDRFNALYLAHREYRNKFGVVPPHYIITSDPSFGNFGTHVILCSEVPKDEAIKIIREYEPIVLWELSGI